MAVRVMLVDDHEIVRRGIADLIGTAEDLEVVGEASGVAEALARVPQVKPDVAVLDVRMPDEPPDPRLDLCTALVSTKRPWIVDHGWWQQLHREDSLWRIELENLAELSAWNESPIPPLTLLYLPYLETQVRQYWRILPRVPLIHELWLARVAHKVYPELAEMFATLLPDNVADFLASWACGDFDVVVAPEP